MSISSRWLCLVVLLFGCLPILAQTTETVTYAYTGYPMPIVRDSADITSIAGIVVPRALKVSKVTVRVQIEFPAVGDLDVSLYSPDGTRVKLLEGDCGALRNVDTTFDDASQTYYRDFCPVEPGRGPFHPNESLGEFGETDSSIGTWRLVVENSRSDEHTGWLTGYALTITGTRQLHPSFRSDTVLNAASVLSGAVAPGEVVSIVGIGLGPLVGVAAPPGAWPTTLGGVVATVSGTPAPIGYASMYRVDVQVPYGLTSNPISFQVSYNNQTSTAVEVPVQNTFPGVYTTQLGGVGQIKAINQDGTQNSKQNPAPRGSVIAIFASGLGPVNPAVAAGQVPPSSPLSGVTNPVSAFIGGLPATVTWAGLAPVYPGLYQANIIVPNGVPAGTRDIVIANAGSSSQGSVFLEVR